MTPYHTPMMRAGVLTCTLTNARVVEIALVFGFSIATLVYCSASFSGARFDRQRPADRQAEACNAPIAQG